MEAKNQDASNVFTFMTIMVIIPYILYTLVSGVSGFSCSVLALCVNTCTFTCSVTRGFYQHKQCRIGMYLKNAM